MVKFYSKILTVIFCLITVGHLSSQVTYYSKSAATDFNATTSWGTNPDGSGGAPGSISNADNFVIQNGSSMTLTANADVRSLTINAGTLTVSANTLTVSIASQNTTFFTVANDGQFNISGGTVQVNGSMTFANGSGCNQSGGLIVIKPNSGTAGTSYSGSSPVFGIGFNSTTTSQISTPTNSAKFQFTGGTLQIVDPPFGTTPTYTFAYNSVSGSNVNFSDNHNLKFGDGTSTLPCASANGFYSYCWYGTGYLSWGNVEVDILTGTNRVLRGTSTHGILGNMNIVSGDVGFNSSTYYSKNITNNGTLRHSSTTYFGSWISGAATTTSFSQTISGAGSFFNTYTTTTTPANFLSLTINNISSGGVTFSGQNSMRSTGNTGTVSGTLTFTAGKVNTGTDTFYLGTLSTGASTPTLSYTSGGFGSGSTFARWYGTTTGTTISASTVPSIGTGSFPFISGNPVNGLFARHFHRSSVAMTTAGFIRVTFTDGSGTSSMSAVTDGAYTVNEQTAARWNVGLIGTAALGANPTVCVQAQNAFYTAANNQRLLINNAVVGTHQAGTNHPMGQRSAVPTANFAGEYSIGVNSSEIPNTTIASGELSNGAIWSSGSAPACGALGVIRLGDSVTVSTGSTSVGSLVVNGTLAIDGGTLTVGCTGSNRNDSIMNNGKLYVTTGTLNLNGRIQNASAARFWQTGGTINVDGNSGTASTSVGTGVAMMGWSAGVQDLRLTGGNLNIINPHKATSGNVIAYSSTSTPYPFVTTGHTTTIGNGTSTIAPGTYTAAFNIGVGTRFQFGNLVINSTAAQGRTVFATGSNVIHGNLTITDGALVLGTGTNVIGGNITNNDTLYNPTGTIAFATVFNANMSTPTQSPDSTAQTVSGSGVFFNNTTPASATANFTSITIHNEPGLGGTTFNTNHVVTNQPTNSISCSGTLTFTKGTATISSGKLFVLGVPAGASPATGTLSYTAGGFTTGSNVGISWTTTSTGATITAGAVPTSTAGRIPFVSSDNKDRSIWISRGAGTFTAGYTAATFTEASGTTTGLSLTDASGYVVQTRSNDKWTLASTNSTTPSGTFAMAINAPDEFGGSLSADSARIHQSAGFVGTHQRGTVNASAQRTALTVAQLTSGDFYLGANDAQIPNTSITSGNWNSTSTWSKGTVPSCSDNVIINSGHTVTVNSSGNNANNVSINTGGTLVSASGDLTVGCTNNNALFTIVGGTYSMNGGTLNVNGKFFLNFPTTSTFNQTGGSIVVDGNSGVSTTSILGHIVDMYSFSSSTLNLVGGSFTIKDPTLSTNTGDHTFKVYPNTLGLVSGSGTGWALNFGDGSTGGNRGGHSSGALLNVSNSTTSFKINGPITVNMRQDSANRHVQSAIYFACKDITVTKGDLRLASTTYVDGNITNNDTLTSSSTLNLTNYSGSTVIAASGTQTIGGSGVYRNNATPASVTANVLSLTVNNTNSTGVTLNVPISVSGTLTMTNGIINTTSSNYLRLGTTTSAGTLSGYTPSSTCYVNGPFERYTVANSTPTSITGSAITHPVGEAGRALPMWIYPKTAAAGAAIMVGQAFTTGFTGSAGGGVSNLSSNYWIAEPHSSTSGNFQGGFVGVGDTITNGSGTQKLLTSNSASGVFNGTSGGSAFVTGTPNSVRQSASIDLLNYSNYYAYGDLTPCSAPIAHASNLAISFKTTTTATLKFDSIAVPNTATGYLVIVDSNSSISSTGYVNPTDGVSYATGYQSALSARVVGYYTTSPFNVSITGLSASTAYDVYVIPYNNSGCAGPTYYTVTPPSATFTTCGANPVTPTTAVYSLQSSNGFSMGWNASTTAGVDHVVQVATNSTFTSFVPGYADSNVTTSTSLAVGGLTPGTTYWARVRAQDAAGCVSTTFLTSNSIATDNATGVTTFSDNFDAQISGTAATTWPTGWKKVSNIGTAYLSTTASSAPNAILMSGSTTVPPTISMPQVTNNSASSHRLRFKLRTATAGIKLYVGYLTNPADPATFIAIDSFTRSQTTAFEESIEGPINVPNSTLAFKTANTTGTYYIDDVFYEVMPACATAEAGTISTTTTGSVCFGSGVSFTATGYNKDSLNLGYVWQTSPDSITWTNKGSVSASYANLTDTPTSTTYYRLRVECTSSGTVYDTSNQIKINVTSPSITGTTTDTVCGTGSVTLIATGTDTAFNWYNVATGGTPLSTNDTFNVTIDKDSTFYVETGSGVAPAGFPLDGAWDHNSTAGGFQTTTNTGAIMMFTVTSPVTMSSVDIYPSASMGTSFTIEIRNPSGTGGSGGTLVGTYTGTTTVVNSGTPTVAQTVPVNFYLPPGVYLMGFTSNPNTWRSNPTTCNYPWTHPSGSIVCNGSSASGSTTITQIYQYYFFNIKIGYGCFSPRTAVVAKSNTPPSITASANQGTICNGNPDTLNVSSTNGGYTYTWSNSLGAGAQKIVTPTSSTTYSVSAADNSGGANQGCSTTANVTVNVNAKPSAINFNTTDTTFNCSTSVKSLTFTGGSILANALTATGTTTGTGTYYNPLYCTYENVKTHLLYTAAELNALGMTSAGYIDTIGIVITAQTATYDITSFSVSMANSSNTNLSTGYGTPNTSFTNVFPASNIGKPAAGTFKIPLTTPFYWDGTSNLLIEFCKDNDVSNSGTFWGGTTTIQYTATATAMVYGQYADNASQCGGGTSTGIGNSLNRLNLYIAYRKPLNKIWSPNTGLYTDMGATAAYTGTSRDTVHAKPTATTKYYLTVTDPATSCFMKDSILDSVTSSTTNVALASGTITGAAAQCTEASGWTYYGSASDPAKWIFAINKGGSGMTGESINVEVLGSIPSSTSTSGTNQEHASYFMKRGWDVTGTVPTGSVSVRFFYDPADSSAVIAQRDADSITTKTANPNSLLVKTPFKWFKSNGVPYNAAWRATVSGNRFPTSHVNLTPSAFGTINGVNYVEFSGITSFSGGSGGAGFGAPGAGGGVGLPVTWAGFDVTVAEEGNILVWKTSSEQNTSHFEVEYSYDGTNYFKSSRTIPAAGYSTTLKTYTYTHPDFSSYVYYRIKQVDKDGRSDNSVTKVAKRAQGSPFQVSVHPIPMNEDNELHVVVKSIDQSNLSIRFIDMNGREVVKKTVVPTASYIDQKFTLEHLSGGIYQIEVQNGQGKEVIKFVK